MQVRPLHPRLDYASAWSLLPRESTAAMEPASVFGVVVPASMHGDRQSWIAIVESGAASAVRFSKARKAWAKEWSPAIRVS